VTVGVLPPFNDSMTVDAPKKVWPMVDEETAARGYRTVPRERIEEFFRRNQFVFPEEILQYDPKDLAKEWGCQGLVYSRLEEYGQKYAVLSREVRVRIRVELLDCRTGEVLWRGVGEAGDSSAAGNGIGLGTLLVQAMVSEALASEVESYARKACARAFRALPLAGFAPSPK